MRFARRVALPSAAAVAAAAVPIVAPHGYYYHYIILIFTDCRVPPPRPLRGRKSAPGPLYRIQACRTYIPNLPSITAPRLHTRAMRDREMSRACNRRGYNNNIAVYSN